MNFNSKTSSEFTGEHPSIIIRTVSIEDLYYIIPLTTFTNERWEKYKKQFGCRIISTGSIALVSKMQVRHKNNIKSRSVSNNLEPSLLLVPQPNEIKAVLDKLDTYISTATKKSYSMYNKFFNEYNIFDNDCSCLNNINCGEFTENSVFTLFKKSSDYIMLKLEGKTVKNLSIRDVSWILTKHIPNKLSINYYQDYYLIKIEKAIANI